MRLGGKGGGCHLGTQSSWNLIGAYTCKLDGQTDEK